MPPLNLNDFEPLARERLDPLAYDYYRSGAADQRTLAANLAAFERVELLPRVLVDVSKRSLATTCLGTDMPMPVAIAPTAFHRLADPEGEIATARAAAVAGTPMTLSTLSNSSIEAVAEASLGPLWFQLYVFRDRGLTESLVARAAEAGYRAILVTVDAPFLGVREADVRNRFGLPDGLTIASIADGSVPMPEGLDGSGLAAFFAEMLDPSLTWEDLEWLVSVSELPVAVKGVHRAEDAVRAADAGAAGVIVSNHGGRQLDTVPASLDMLPAVAEAAGERVEVLMDGGVRRATDVIKALALGARAVLLGRPILWALAAEGQAGVERALELLRAELDLAMALCGCTSVGEVGPELVAHPPHQAVW